MKRLFVSLPMKGKTDDEIQKGIREAYEKVKTLYPQEIPYLQAAKVLREVSDAPAADVAPVRQGRWVFGKDLPYSWGQIPKNKYHLYCSECLEQAFNRSEDNDPDFDVDTSYCPNCGAKMDLEEEK